MTKGRFERTDLPKTKHLYEIHGTVEILYAMDDGWVTARGQDGRQLYFWAQGVDLVHVGPSLESGFYVDENSSIWKHDGQKWTHRNGQILLKYDRSDPTPGPTGKLTRLEEAETVHV